MLSLAPARFVSMYFLSTYAFLDHFLLVRILAPKSFARPSLPFFHHVLIRKFTFLPVRYFANMSFRGSRRKRPRSESSQFFERSTNSPGGAAPSSSSSSAFQTVSPAARPPRSSFAVSRVPRTPVASGLNNHGTSSAPRVQRASTYTDSDNYEESAEEIRARENDDAINEVIMAVDMQKCGTIGCAYYTAREQALHLIEDSRMGGIDIVETMKLAIDPTVILISTKAEEALDDLLTKSARNDDDLGMYLVITRYNN